MTDIVERLRNRIDDKLADAAADEIAGDRKLEIARPLHEWHEDFGDVLWWTFPITEPPYVGSPLDCGQPVEVRSNHHTHTFYVGGWPGYHTHWTPLPRTPTPR